MVAYSDILICDRNLSNKLKSPSCQNKKDASEFTIVIICLL